MSSAVAIGETLFDEAGKPIDYSIIDVNPAYERLTGQRADQVIGMHALARIHRCAAGGGSVTVPSR